jgi:hypothetical protein
MNEIEIFGNFSGLMINRNKTEGLWIGKLKHSKDKVEISFLYFSGITQELTIKVKIGIIKALMISTLPNIERFRFDHDKRGCGLGN